MILTSPFLPYSLQRPPPTEEEAFVRLIRLQQHIEAALEDLRRPRKDFGGKAHEYEGWRTLRHGQYESFKEEVRFLRGWKDDQHRARMGELVKFALDWEKEWIRSLRSITEQKLSREAASFRALKDFYLKRFALLESPDELQSLLGLIDHVHHEVLRFMRRRFEKRAWLMGLEMGIAKKVITTFYQEVAHEFTRLRVPLNAKISLAKKARAEAVRPIAAS